MLCKGKLNFNYIKFDYAIAIPEIIIENIDGIYFDKTRRSNYVQILVIVCTLCIEE